MRWLRRALDVAFERGEELRAKEHDGVPRAVDRHDLDVWRFDLRRVALHFRSRAVEIVGALHEEHRHGEGRALTFGQRLRRCVESRSSFSVS